MPFHVLCALNYVRQYFVYVECVKFALDSTMNVLNVVADMECIQLSFPAAVVCSLIERLWPTLNVQRTLIDCFACPGVRVQ